MAPFKHLGGESQPVVMAHILVNIVEVLAGSAQESVKTEQDQGLLRIGDVSKGEAAEGRWTHVAPPISAHQGLGPWRGGMSLALALGKRQRCRACWGRLWMVGS